MNYELFFVPLPHKDQLYDEKTTNYRANDSFSDLLVRSGEGL